MTRLTGVGLISIELKIAGKLTGIGERTVEAVSALMADLHVLQTCIIFPEPVLLIAIEERRR